MSERKKNLINSQSNKKNTKTITYPSFYPPRSIPHSHSSSFPPKLVESSKMKQQRQQKQLKVEIESLLIYISQCPTIPPESTAARVALNALKEEWDRVERDEILVKKLYQTVSGYGDGGDEENKDNADEDEDEDSDSDVVHVSDSMIIDASKQECWMEWQNIDSDDDNSNGVESLVDDMVPITINNLIDTANSTDSTDTTNNSKATNTSSLNNINNASSIYIHNHGIVQGIMPFLPSHSCTTANSTNNGTKSTNLRYFKQSDSNELTVEYVKQLTR